MMHLSRFSEEIILWCSWEFKFIELDDAFTTGSSIMPQKKNPDVTELIRGKTGRVYGDLNTLLTVMKGIPLAYNKDMQEDKEAIFDAVDTLELCLRTFTPMLATMTPLPANMRRAAQGLYQRHRLRRLPGQKGHAVPGCLRHRHDGGTLYGHRQNAGRPDAGGVQAVPLFPDRRLRRPLLKLVWKDGRSTVARLRRQ